jgi:hypothetical protein
MSGPISHVRGFSRLRSDRLTGHRRIPPRRARTFSHSRSLDQSVDARRRGQDSAVMADRGPLGQSDRPTVSAGASSTGAVNRCRRPRVTHDRSRSAFGNQLRPCNSHYRAIALTASSQVSVEIPDFDVLAPAVDQSDPYGNWCDPSTGSRPRRAGRGASFPPSSHCSGKAADRAGPDLWRFLG